MIIKVEDVGGYYIASMEGPVRLVVAEGDTALEARRNCKEALIDQCENSLAALNDLTDTLEQATLDQIIANMDAFCERIKQI